MTISFFKECRLPTSTAQQRKFTRFGSYLPDAGKYAKAFWQAVMEGQKPEAPFKGPVRVKVVLHYPHTQKTVRQATADNLRVAKTSRPDLDNASKMILDAMTKAGYWADDSQVYSLAIEKYHCDMTGVQVEVTP